MDSLVTSQTNESFFTNNKTDGLWDISDHIFYEKVIGNLLYCFYVYEYFCGRSRILFFPFKFKCLCHCFCGMYKNR